MRSFWAPMGIAIAVITLAAVPWRPGGGSAPERAKAATAFRYFEQIEAAQARHYAQNGVFASELEQLDVDLSLPQHFQLWIAPNEDGGQSWQMQLTRRPGGGAKRLYSVVWDNTGYSRELSVIDERLLPSSAERAQ